MTKGLARAGFDLDLEHGLEREGELAKILSLSGGDHIEVKSDFKCRTTGNLFVEYQQKGRPSGIQTTEAEWWAFEYHDNCWLIVPTDVLLRKARLAWQQGFRRQGGDSNNYDGVLVPLLWLTSSLEVSM